MSRLSDSQLVILSTACQRPDRCVFPVKSKLKGNAVGNVLKAMWRNLEQQVSVSAEEGEEQPVEPAALADNIAGLIRPRPPQRARRVFRSSYLS